MVDIRMLFHLGPRHIRYKPLVHMHVPICCLFIGHTYKLPSMLDNDGSEWCFCMIDTDIKFCNLRKLTDIFQGTASKLIRVSGSDRAVTMVAFFFFSRATLDRG